MIAGVVTEIAEVVSAAALLVLAASVWLLIWRRGFQKLDVKVAGMEAQLTGVESQFKNNGGSSMRDAIDRIERRQAEIADEVTRLAEAGRALATRVGALEHPELKEAG